MQPGTVGEFNLVMFFHTLLLTMLIVAMSKERLDLDQRMKAQTDPLTGALNRRAFMSRGERRCDVTASSRSRCACSFSTSTISSRSTTGSAIPVATTC